jgi:hypothetical protein
MLDIVTNHVVIFLGSLNLEVNNILNLSFSVIVLRRCRLIIFSGHAKFARSAKSHSPHNGELGVTTVSVDPSPPAEGLEPLHKGCA